MMENIVVKITGKNLLHFVEYKVGGEDFELMMNAETWPNMTIKL